jgi:hypothetical protein
LQALLLCALATVACRTTHEPPRVEELLEPLPVSAGVWMPDTTDLAAARVSESALAAPPLGLEQAFQELALESAIVSAEDERILPLAADLVNATLNDDLAYRSASDDLLKTYSVEPVSSRALRTIPSSSPMLASSTTMRSSGHAPSTPSCSPSAAR